MDRLPPCPKPRTPRNAQPLAYGADPAQVLDVYLPLGSLPGRRPLIVYVPGGAWVIPNRTTIACGQRPGCVPALAAQLDHGYVLAAIDYRLATQAVFPAQVADVKLAVRWLRRHAARYRIDPDRVVLAGHSAGGTLAALAALTPGRWEPAAGMATHVAGFVNLVGPTDLAAWAAWADQPGAGRPEWIAESVSRLVGGDYRAAAQAGPLAAASPMTWVHAGAPPGYLVSKHTDPFVPCAQLRALYEALVQGHRGQAVAGLDGFDCAAGGESSGEPDRDDQHRHNPDWDLDLAALRWFLDRATAGAVESGH